jgi:Domain of unknown function (DUF397)
VFYSGWRKSSFSDCDNGCVEVTASDTRVHIRDTKQHGAGPVITFTEVQWRVFLTEVIDGALPRTNRAVTVTHDRGDWLVRATTGDELRFTPTEWRAFRSGAASGEFDLPSTSSSNAVETRDRELQAARSQGHSRRWAPSSTSSRS